MYSKGDGCLKEEGNKNRIGKLQWVSEETSPGPEAWPKEKEASMDKAVGGWGPQRSDSLQEEGREGPRLAGDCMRRQRAGWGYRGEGAFISVCCAPPRRVTDKGSLTGPLESFPGYPGLEGRLPFQEPL